jgi:mannose-6-phosphate isomerase-like protein (cupin superfamily)
MAEIKVVRSKDVESDTLPDAKQEVGFLKRIIYPHKVPAKGFFFGVGEAKTGYSIHRWHSHTIDRAKGLKVVYPKNFEELYYIVRGRGVVQWKTKDGGIQEEKVRAGDTILFPPGVPKHQLLNTGNQKMFVVLCGSPPIKVTLRKPKKLT